MLIVDTKEIEEVQRHLQRLPHAVFRTEVAKRALLKAVEPTLLVMRANTPVGSKVYVPKSGKNANDLTYARGGYLKKAIRKKNTNYQKFGEVTAIVGYSKKLKQAGWRAHFTDQGFTHYRSKKHISGQNWIKPSETLTQSLVEDLFVIEVQREVDKLFGGL
jgi:hypothetical protein